MSRNESEKKRKVRLAALRYTIYIYCANKLWDVKAQELVDYLATRGTVIMIGKLRKLCTHWGFDSKLSDGFFIGRKPKGEGRPATIEEIAEIATELKEATMTVKRSEIHDGGT